MDCSNLGYLRLGSGKSPKLSLYLKSFPIVSINLLLTSLITEYVYHLVPKNNSMTIVQCIISVICYMILGDVWFYCFHRLFHINKYLYRKIHAQHHFYTEPFAFSAIECHPIEHIIVNLCTVFIGPLILSKFGYLSLNSSIIWTIVSSWGTCMTHSGYKMFEQVHFNHHLYLTCNYGSSPYICDRIFGTYNNNIQ